jgi:bifunctional DNase/RNase
LREVQISRLAETVFYAVAVVEGPAGTTSIDARPSDALNLALLVGAPIRAEAAVLAQGDVLFRPGDVAAPGAAETAESERESRQPMEPSAVFFGSESRGAAEIAAEVAARTPGATRRDRA